MSAFEIARKQALEEIDEIKSLAESINRGFTGEIRFKAISKILDEIYKSPSTIIYTNRRRTSDSFVEITARIYILTMDELMDLSQHERRIIHGMGIKYEQIPYKKGAGKEEFDVKPTFYVEIDRYGIPIEPIDVDFLFRFVRL
jgi:hypothetical protein